MAILTTKIAWGKSIILALRDLIILVKYTVLCRFNNLKNNSICRR